MYQLTILNWEKYNPRKDVKKPSWFRLENDLLSSAQFFSFNNGEMLAWIYMMSLASKAASPTFMVNEAHAEVTCRIKKKDMKSAIEKLVELQIVAVDVTRTSRGRHAHGTSLHATNERTNEHYEQDEHNTPTLTGTGASDSKVFKLTNEMLEAVYLTYPRKEGKTKGFDKAKADVKSQAELDLLFEAVAKYNAHIRSNRTEAQFIRHFSTFMTTWREWLDPNHGTAMSAESEDIFALVRPQEGA